jgi:glycerophosphoryl diester phosphodiesterase
MYERAVSNENTPFALADLATRVPGAICEIDTWRIADGTVIVWHDRDWRRVADPDTLPAGVGPRDRVTEATWEQVRQIRTRGGEPVARLNDMIDAAAQYDVTVAVDMRNRIGNINVARPFVERANQAGADVRYYQLIPASCATRSTDPFRDAGAMVGVKILRQCTTITPAEIDQRGFSFTQQPGFFLSDAYLQEMDARGIDVGVLAGGDTEDRARSLIQRGVDRILLDDPVVALGWNI